MVFELPYWALTTGLNVLITLVLAFRLIRMRQAVVQTLGEVHAKLYTSVIAMIVESAVIYAAVGLICIITFAVGSNILNFVEPILGQILVRNSFHHPYRELLADLVYFISFSASVRSSSS